MTDPHDGEAVAPIQPLPAYLTYTVESGDTLTSIAEAHNLTVEDVLRWNPISDPDKIAVGDVINLYDAGADFEYTVVEGDTVSGLAERFDKRWVDIAAVNKLDDLDLILVGQKLLIPGQGVARR